MGSTIANQVNHARVRARGRGLSATLSVDGWKLTLEDFENRCAYCGGPPSTLDHFLSLARGGTSDIDNCVPSCERCNSLKGDTLPHQVLHVKAERMEQIRQYLSERKAGRRNREVLHTPLLLTQQSIPQQERKREISMTVTVTEEQRRTLEQRLVHGEKVALYSTPEQIVFRLSKSCVSPLDTSYQLHIPLNRKECILLARDLLDIASTHVPLHKPMDIVESPFALE